MGVAALMAAFQVVAMGGVVARLFAIGMGVVLFFQMALFWSWAFANLRGARRGERDVERPDPVDFSVFAASLAGSLALLPLLWLANTGVSYSIQTDFGELPMPRCPASSRAAAGQRLHPRSAASGCQSSTRLPSQSLIQAKRP